MLVYRSVTTIGGLHQVVLTQNGIRLHFLFWIPSCQSPDVTYHFGESAHVPDMFQNMSTSSSPTVCIPNQQNQQTKLFFAPKNVSTWIYPQPVCNLKNGEKKSGSPPINSILWRESLGSFVSQPGEKTTPQSVSSKWHLNSTGHLSERSPSTSMHWNLRHPLKQLYHLPQIKWQDLSFTEKNSQKKSSCQKITKPPLHCNAKHPNPNIWSTTPRSPSHHLQRYVHVHDGWHHESLQETPRSPMATSLWLHSDLHVTNCTISLIFFAGGGGKMTLEEDATIWLWPQKQ